MHLGRIENCSYWKIFNGKRKFMSLVEKNIVFQYNLTMIYFSREDLFTAN